MPVLVLAVSEDLHKLLENRSLTAVASLRELSRVMIVAVNMAVVLVVAVLGAEYGRTQRAGEMVDVVLAVECSDVGAAQSPSTLEAEEAKPAEVVRLAKRVLSLAVIVVDRKELGGYNLAAVLWSIMVRGAKGRKGSVSTRTRHLKQSRWKVPSSARTNWPVSGSPHFLQILCWPLAERPPLPLDLLRSRLCLGSPSLPGVRGPGERECCCVR